VGRQTFLDGLRVSLQALSDRHAIRTERCFTSAPPASERKCRLEIYAKINGAAFSGNSVAIRPMSTLDSLESLRMGEPLTGALLLDGPE
jgi:hypothetical protein